MSKVKLTKEEKMQLKHEKFILRMRETFGEEYTVLGTFLNTSTKVLIKHNKCNHEWMVLPANLFAGQSKCPKCSNRVKYTDESFSKALDELTNGEYILVGNIRNAKAKTVIKHTTCGYDWKVSPNVILTGSRCPRCNNKERYTTEDFADLVSNTTNNEYVLKSEYVNNRVEVEINHVTCDTNFKTSPVSFLYSVNKCPECQTSMSSGEKRIFDYLSSRNIKFIREYTNDDCKDIHVLRFDFAIKERFYTVGMIEFDGAQHFRSVEYWGGEEGFKDTQRRDNIKNEFCKAKNIPLLRIPYWEYDNIEQLVESFLLKIKSKKSA